MARVIAVLLSLFLFLPLAAPANDDIGSMSTDEIIEQAPSLHPAALYVLSARLLGEGKGQEAANWMYAGQLRYRFMIAVLGDAGQNERTLFSALTEQVGRPVNEYIAGDPDEWIAAMQWALDWDAANDNFVTSKTEHEPALGEIREGLEALITQVDENRDTIREQREENGLPNR